MSEDIVDSTATAPQGDAIPQNAAGDLQQVQAAYRLNGKNYLKWSLLVRTILNGKGKISHLLGTGPGSNDPDFNAWDEEDSMIMAWLWNSMSPEISDTCMFLPTAKDIWDAVQQTYSKALDAAQVYEIKVKTVAAKQGSKSVTEYANYLKSLWQELDHYRCIKTRCPEDAVILKNYIEKDRVYDFLVGLNVEYDQVRVQILGKELPSLNETISIVRAEESRRGVMLEPAPAIEGSAMASTKTAEHKKPAQQPHSATSKTESADTLWCTYCKKSRHTRERCWKLHGKPTTASKDWGSKGGQPRNNGQVNVASTQIAKEELRKQDGFNQTELQQLRSLLGTLEKPVGKCSMAHSGQGFGEDDWTC